MIRVEKQSKIGIITIDHGDYNALSSKVLIELNQALNKLVKDKKINVIVISGKKNFAAGGDIKEMEKLRGKAINRFVKIGKAVIKTIIQTSKVVICAVNGYALGAGSEICHASDIVIAAPNAKFGQPEVKLGIIPGFGGCVLLAKHVGVHIAKQIIFSGKIIEAKDAKAMGIINNVVANPLVEAVRLGNEISSNSAKAVGISKMLLNKGLVNGFEDETKLFIRTFKGNDRSEGIKAFLEKRKPQFG